MLKFIILILSFNVYAFEEPNIQITSGDFNHKLTKKVLCVPNYTSGLDAEGNKVRNVSSKIKNIVFNQYNIKKEDRSKYVIDHMVNLSIGGTNKVSNLWPQQKTEAKKKDKLENKLHKLVCSGKISLIDAQLNMKNGWSDDFEKYFK